MTSPTTEAREKVLNLLAKGSTHWSAPGSTYPVVGYVISGSLLHDIAEALSAPVTGEGMALADLNELRVVCDVNTWQGDTYRIQATDDLSLGVLRRLLAALSTSQPGRDR